MGRTDRNPGSYGLWNDGDVSTNGVISTLDKEAPSITDHSAVASRPAIDRVFKLGDEVLVGLDCAARTVRIVTPTVDHEFTDLPAGKQWVLSICGKDVDVEMLPFDKPWLSATRKLFHMPTHMLPVLIASARTHWTDRLVEIALP